MKNIASFVSLEVPYLDLITRAAKPRDITTRLQLLATEINSGTVHRHSLTVTTRADVGTTPLAALLGRHFSS